MKESSYVQRFFQSNEKTGFSHDREQSKRKIRKGYEKNKTTLWPSFSGIVPVQRCGPIIGPHVYFWVYKIANIRYRRTKFTLFLKYYSFYDFICIENSQYPGKEKCSDFRWGSVLPNVFSES